MKMKNKKQNPVTEKEIKKELRTKRAKTRNYWYIVAIERATGKRWYYDFYEGELCGRPMKESCAYPDWDLAFNEGICFGLRRSDFLNHDVYIVHDGYAEYIRYYEAGDEPYPGQLYFECED